MQIARPGLSRPLRRAIAVGGALLCALVWQPLSLLLWQVFFALLMTGLALPLCQWLENWWGRPLAALLSVGALVLLLAGMIALLVPPIVEQIRLLIAQAPHFFQQIQQLWERLKEEEWFSAFSLDADMPLQWTGRAAAWLGESLPGLINRFLSGVEGLSRGILSPFLTFYFLRDREIFAYHVSLWIPARYRKRALAALQGMRREAGGYVRGQLLVALAVGLLTAAGLLLVGVPAWLVLGLIMGLCELIPYVGPLIGGVPIAVFSLPLGFSAMVWALGVTVAVQQIEGLFLSPFLVGGATGLHPVAVMLLLSAGGLLFGLPGMVLVLPAFLCLRGGIRVFFASDDP